MFNSCPFIRCMLIRLKLLWRSHFTNLNSSIRTLLYEIIRSFPWLLVLSSQFLEVSTTMDICFVRMFVCRIPAQSTVKHLRSHGSSLRVTGNISQISSATFISHRERFTATSQLITTVEFASFIEYVIVHGNDEERKPHFKKVWHILIKLCNLFITAWWLDGDPFFILWIGKWQLLYCQW